MDSNPIPAFTEIKCYRGDKFVKQWGLPWDTTNFTYKIIFTNRTTNTDDGSYDMTIDAYDSVNVVYPISITITAATLATNLINEQYNFKIKQYSGSDDGVTIIYGRFSQPIL